MVEGWSGYRLQMKLKELRGKFREWNAKRGVWGSEKIKILEGELHEVVTRMERDGVSDDLRKNRLQILNHLWKEYRLEERMWLQKARVNG